MGYRCTFVEGQVQLDRVVGYLGNRVLVRLRPRTRSLQKTASEERVDGCQSTWAWGGLISVGDRRGTHTNVLHIPQERESACLHSWYVTLVRTNSRKTYLSVDQEPRQLAVRPALPPPQTLRVLVHADIRNHIRDPEGRESPDEVLL